MASRMDRYVNNEARSKKNESLYRQIQDFGSYSNIEGVATIEHTNEVDITKIKEMLKNRENYQKEKKYRQLIKEKKTEDPLKIDPLEEERVYDVMDVLKQAREDRKAVDERSRYRSLKNTQYDILKKLNIDKNNTSDLNQEEELRELIDTISMKSKMANDDLGLFDDLKSDTMVGDVRSIKPYINKNDCEADDTTETNLLKDMDKSFFTSSLDLSNDDFEDLKDLQQNMKTNNKLLKTLIIVVIIIIAIVLGYFIFKMLF